MSRTSSPKGLVIFDLDNTVVHSTIDFARIRRDLIGLLRAQRITTESDSALARRSIGQIIELADAHDGWAGTHVGAESWRIVLEYERAGMREASVEPDATETLQVLRDEGWLLAILTNNARAATLDALGKFGMTDCFNLVVSRDDAAMKPNPAGIDLARAALGGCGRTVMVGDSWLDGTAAERASVPFVAFRPKPGLLEDRKVRAWTVIARLADLAEVLPGLWSGTPDSFGAGRGDG